MLPVSQRDFVEHATLFHSMGKQRKLITNAIEGPDGGVTNLALRVELECLLCSCYDGGGGGGGGFRGNSHLHSFISSLSHQIPFFA